MTGDVMNVPAWFTEGARRSPRTGAGWPTSPMNQAARKSTSNRFPQMGTAYDVSPDGHRFLMISETDETISDTQIVVVAQ